MAAKSTYKDKAEWATESNHIEPNMQGLRFNMEGLNAYLDEGTKVLHIEMPAIILDGYPLTEQAVNSMKEAGATISDIESSVDKMLEELQTRIVARMLAKRRV